MAASDSTTGRGRPVGTLKRPPVFRGQPYSAIVAFLVALVVFRLVWVDGLANEKQANTWLLYSVLVIGFYFVFGVSGQFAFSQAAFAGLGAYTSQWASKNHSFWLGLAAALASSAVISMLFALLVKRAAHFYFAIATLGVSEILILVFEKWKSLNGGLGGEVTNIRDISIFGRALDSYGEQFAFLLVLLGIVMTLGAWLERSPFVRENIANRDHEVVSKTLGIPSLQLRVTSFVLGSVLAGLTGACWGALNGFIETLTWGVELGLGVFLMLILGGIGSRWGAIVGAWFYTYIVDFLDKAEKEFPSLIGGRQIVYGGVLVIVMIALPDGIVGIWGRIRRPKAGAARQASTPNWLVTLLGLKRASRPEPLAAAETEASDDTLTDPTSAGTAPSAPSAADPTSARASTAGDGPALVADTIAVSFGGVKAVAGVSLTLHQNEILGLIGPNGSGKSTFLNAVNGVVPATGSLSINGQPVRLGNSAGVRKAGLLRTYQTPQTFLHLSCIENVLLSTADRRYTGIAAAWFLRPLMLKHEKARWARAEAALERVGLLDKAERSAAGLSYGQQRLLEVARVIAAEPTIILLDEPSAGLNAAETQILARHLRSLRDEGISLLVVDHKIDFISDLCERVAVLELGTLVAEGDPVTIWDDERVINAYLGVADDDDPVGMDDASATVATAATPRPASPGSTGSEA